MAKAALASGILSDTGSIWITLDHHEAHRARQMWTSFSVSGTSWRIWHGKRFIAPEWMPKGSALTLTKFWCTQKARPKCCLHTGLRQNGKQFTYVEPETGKKARLRTLRKRFGVFESDKVFGTR